jgi:hypothetical protein
MKKLTTVLALTGLAALGASVPVVAGGQQGSQLGSALQRQRAVSSDPDTTSSRRWKDVRGYVVLVCAKAAVSATAFVNVDGAPVEFRFSLDNGATFRPNAGRFDPRDGTTAFTLMGVQRATTFEGTDSHAITLQWRSPTREFVTLERGIMNVLYEKGECP